MCYDLDMSSSEQFKIESLALEVIESYESAERGDELVQLIMSAIPPVVVEEALRQTIRRLLPTWELERQARNRAADRRMRKTRQKPTSEKRYASSKVRELRETYYPAFLRNSIPGATGRVLLAQATVPDLNSYIEQLRKHASGTIRNAERHERLRDILLERGVPRVCDLNPEDWDVMTA